MPDRSCGRPIPPRDAPPARHPRHTSAAGTPGLTGATLGRSVRPAPVALDPNGAAFLAAVANHAEYETEYRVIRPRDGRVAWIAERGSPVVDADGEAYMRGIHWDITARKQAEEALRQSEEQQAFLLQLSDALRPLADPAEIQRAAMRVVGAFLGVDRAMYSDITPDGETALVTDNYLSGRLPAFKARFPLPPTAAPSWTGCAPASSSSCRTSTCKPG